MRLTRKPPVCPGRLRKCILLIPVIVCVYISSFVAFIPQASAATLSYPGGNVADPVVRRVDIDRPAVVRIITTLNGRLTVHFEPTSDVETFPLGGGSYPLELSGSGAFISSHGDLLTADHVVNPPHDQSMDEYLYSLAANDIANYVNSHFQVSQPFAEGDVIASLESDSFPSSASYSTPSSVVYLSTAYTGPVNADRFEDVPASNFATVDKIEAQSAVDQNDVAIIHVTGMDDMASIQLSDSSQVAEQDNLTIIGYPGNGDISESPTNLLTSSINKVYVSAIKTTDQGAPLIQIGGNVEHGDSGGPALDTNGNIVGTVSFGLADANDIGETTFLQASNSAETLIQTLSLDTTPGSFEKAWAQAFNDYSSSTPGHWHKAAQELQSLANKYNSFLGVTSFLVFAQSQASHETIPAPPSNSSLPVLLVGMLLIVLVIAGILFFAMQKRRHQLALAGRGQTSPVYGAYPAPQGTISGVYPPLPASYGAPGPGYNAPVQGTSEVYPPLPASYGMAPVQETPGVYPPLPASYGATAWYEQPTGQIVQTPLPANLGSMPLTSVQNTPVPENLVEETSQQTVQAVPETVTRVELIDQLTGQVIQTPLTTNPAVMPLTPVQNTPVPENLAEEISQQMVQVAPEPISQVEFTNQPVPLGQNILSSTAKSTGSSPEVPSLQTDEQYAPTLVSSAISAGEGELEDASFIAFTSTGEQTIVKPLPSYPEWAPVNSFAEEEKIAPAQSAPNWNFSVPRRPSAVSVSGSESIEASGNVWTAPCGHLNTPDASFCHECGQSIQSVATNTSEP